QQQPTLHPNSINQKPQAILTTKNPLHPQQQLPPPKQNPDQQINTLNQLTHPQTNTQKPLLNTSQTTTQLPSQLPKPKQLNNL
ncbi:GA module-containing protein, partial [Staphylococcus epidermidis]|uniref:GA module-containing protein n=1 Tax=Staphylococcus epidermidis TaxID=1282 RepID=UPI0011AA2284